MFVALVSLFGLLVASTSAGYTYSLDGHVPYSYDGAYAPTYNNYKPKDYKFEYGVSDPHTGDHKSQWEVKEDGVVRGAYSLLEPDGTTRVVEYIADDDGFRAVVKKLGVGLHEEVSYGDLKPLYKEHSAYGGHYSEYLQNAIYAAPAPAPVPVAAHVESSAAHVPFGPIVVPDTITVDNYGHYTLPEKHIVAHNEYNQVHSFAQNAAASYVPQQVHDVNFHQVAAPVAYNQHVEVAQPIAYNQVEVAQPVYKQHVEVAQPIAYKQVEVAQPLAYNHVEVAHQQPIAYKQVEVAHSQPIAYKQVEVAQPLAYKQVEYAQPLAYKQVEVAHSQPIAYKQVEVAHSQPIAYNQVQVAHSQPIAYKQVEVAHSQPLGYGQALLNNQVSYGVSNVHSAAQSYQNSIVQHNQKEVLLPQQYAQAPYAQQKYVVSQGYQVPQVAHQQVVSSAPLYSSEVQYGVPQYTKGVEIHGLNGNLADDSAYTNLGHESVYGQSYVASPYKVVKDYQQNVPYPYAYDH